MTAFALVFGPICVWIACGQALDAAQRSAFAWAMARGLIAAPFQTDVAPFQAVCRRKAGRCMVAGFAWSLCAALSAAAIGFIAGRAL